MEIQILRIVFFQKLFYCPHPFTNWSLNPHSRYDKNLIHTKEGFRKTSEYDSIIDELELFNNKCDVYCLGGSTTYCDGLKIILRLGLIN